jgi:hypothetical protein
MVAGKSKRSNREDADTPEAVAARRAYEAELKRKKIINFTGLGVSIVAVIFICAIFASGRFSSFMGKFGINFTVSESGIYADCSKRENRNNSYCQPKESSSDMQWREVSSNKGKAVPFSLHGGR